MIYHEDDLFKIAEFSKSVFNHSSHEANWGYISINMNQSPKRFLGEISKITSKIHQKSAETILKPTPKVVTVTSGPEKPMDSIHAKCGDGEKPAECFSFGKIFTRNHGFSPSNIGGVPVKFPIIQFLWSGKHTTSHGKSPSSMGKSTMNGSCSIAMWNYQRVMLAKQCHKPLIYFHGIHMFIPSIYGYLWSNCAYFSVALAKQHVRQDPARNLPFLFWTWFWEKYGCSCSGSHEPWSILTIWLMVIPSIIRILIMVIINPYEPLDD